MASSSAPDLRASDADRERVVGSLRDHAAAGRLEPSELEERVGAALAARTLGALEPLLADLPRRGGQVGRRRRRTRRPPSVFVAVSLLLVAIWAAGGAGDPFWPVWPILGMVAIWTKACPGKGRRRGYSQSSSGRAAPAAPRAAGSGEAT
jgi:hypothetical protein